VADVDTHSEVSIVVEGHDDSDNTVFPAQSWPIGAEGEFKTLAMLSPGVNRLVLRVGDASTTLVLTYMPALEKPPLYLAILVAKDSPLLIACPPIKYGAISTAHSSLEAAITKFRMTAYMWQALTAESFRRHGLGRRSFRLEEEWALDTTSSLFITAQKSGMDCTVPIAPGSGAHRSTAKVHIVRSPLTVKEIRETEGNGIWSAFKDALRLQGGVFEDANRPVVAGLVLDAHETVNHYFGHREIHHHDRLAGYSQRAVHNSWSMSMAVFGSQSCFAWPRFLEEVSTCLRDQRDSGLVTGSLARTCALSQHEFMVGVVHAFGAPTFGRINFEEGTWAQHFSVEECQHEADEGPYVVVGSAKLGNDEDIWSLRQALSVWYKPHFWTLEDSANLRRAQAIAAGRHNFPNVTVAIDNDPDLDCEDEEKAKQLEIVAEAGIARITFNGIDEVIPIAADPAGIITYTRVRYTMEELAKLSGSAFDQVSPLMLTVLGMNGRDTTIGNVWRLFGRPTILRVPGSDIKLYKQSVICDAIEDYSDDNENNRLWHWATLLTRRHEDGSIENATKIDIRTGCLLDGIYVHFGQRRMHCGVRRDYGGHANEARDIPAGREIVKVEVARTDTEMRGLRMYLDDGTAWGALSGDDWFDEAPAVLGE
jgi:hypothetical protein